MTNSLKEDFEKRTKFFTNRASAVFPLFFRKYDNDLLLLWMNYWWIKNGIEVSRIVVNLRIYSSDGTLKVRTSLPEMELHNELSIRSLIDEENFSGMVEIEIVSSSNLRFPFPAISGIYKSGGLYSGVHSAGRIKGSDEPQKVTPTEETNWTCKFGEDITPFFHYFNGPSEELTDITVVLYDSNGDVFKKELVSCQFQPFSSKVYFIDDLFSLDTFSPGMFVGVRCKNSNAFRRMVVGNFHKRTNHLEVTHSFPKQVVDDHCPENKNGFNSFLAMFSHDLLNLKCRVFPTNCSGNISQVRMTQKYTDTSLSRKDEVSLLENGYGDVLLDEDVKFCLLGLNGIVPSRFNTSFVYSVKNCESPYSTDIATGAKSSVYPAKHTHWGPGLVGDGYDFVLMLRNNNHDGTSKESKGVLTFYGLEGIETIDVKIDSESSLNICLSKNHMDGSLLVDGEARFFTWMLNLDQPHSETFWVSFRKSDGCILGCHGY